MLIQAENLWKTYGSGESQVNALQGIDLQVKEGEFVALVGPSGCGKSTLLHLLGAMDTPEKGKILLAEKELGNLGSGALTKIRLKSIGFIFQTFNLIPTLTALENVMLPLRLAGLGKKEAKQRALEVIDLVGLGDRVKHTPAKMSGGQRQRVAIARALVNNPSIILADEPTGNLDSVNGEAVMELLEELNRKGHTIIMVTHNPELAERAGRVIRMRDGKIVTKAEELHTGSKVYNMA